MGMGVNRELISEIPSVRACARALTREREAADDLVQEAVTRALAAQGQYTLGTNFRAWIFRIIRNLHFNDLRRRKFQPERIDDVTPDRWSIDPPQHARVEFGHLGRAFSTLREDHREILTLVGPPGVSTQGAA